MIDHQELWWVPIAAVFAMTGLGVLAARAYAGESGRGGWAIAIFFCGIAALGLTAWQQVATRDLLRQEAALLEELGSRLNQLGQLLPEGPGPTPAETFDTVSAAIRSLNARTAELQEQVSAMEEMYRTRHIDSETAGKLAAYLRQFGPYRVVVSTVPDDVEAFTYANQIANALRDAGWDALGPETTRVFGTPETSAITLFARSGADAPEAVKALIEAFTRFNIPHRSGIAPTDAIPDASTVAVFVSRKA